MPEAESGALLTRRAVAQSLGIGMGTLLFYERSGLIPPPRRAANGYRLYERRDLDRLSLIKKAKALGLSLGEIAEFLEGIAAGRSREECRAGIERKVAAIQREIEELEERKRVLMEMAGSPKLGDCDAIRAVAESEGAGSGRDSP